MRLIDADALGIGKAKREAFENPEYADGWNSAIDIIEQAPTVDAVEVRHATKGLHIGDKFYCSNCRNLTHCTNYCEICGAKMDGKKKVSK